MAYKDKKCGEERCLNAIQVLYYLFFVIDLYLLSSTFYFFTYIMVRIVRIIWFNIDIRKQKVEDGDVWEKYNY